MAFAKEISAFLKGSYHLDMEVLRCETHRTSPDHVRVLRRRGLVGSGR